MKRLGILAAVFLSLAVGTAHAAATQIVAHKDLGITTLTAEDLESIFLGKKTLWESGSKVSPVLLVEDSPGGQEFIEKTLSKTVDQYRAYWRRRVFSGGAAPPRTLASTAEILDFVAKTPGAIGVVEGPVTDERVKIVTLAK